MKHQTGGSECRTLTEAYARFGIRLTNPRTAWSGQGEDGRVVLTLWSNQFADVDRCVYDILDAATGSWIDRPANKQRIQHLKYVQEYRGGFFDSIVITQPDRAYTRIVRREIGPRMRLVQLDPTTGRFRAERVEGLSKRL